MGNAESNPNAPTFTTLQWTAIEPKRKNIPGTPSLFRALNSNLEADCYDIAVLGTFEEHMQNLLRRRNLVTNRMPYLLDVRVKQKHMFECNMTQRLQVYTQKIICRLNEIGLTEKEALYILKQGLQAFVELQRYSNTFFIVTGSMFGFNGNGQLKVWLHQNYGRSEIEQETLARSEYEMLISIVRCFEPFGLRVQNYYSYSNFQQIINHLAKEFSRSQTYSDALESSKLCRSIANKAKKAKNSHQKGLVQQDYMREMERVTVTQAAQVQLWKPNHHQSTYLDQQILKQNANPFKKRDLSQCGKNSRQIVDIPAKKQPQQIRLYRPVSALAQTKQSLKFITRPATYSSIKFINLNASYDHSAFAPSSKQFRKSSPSYPCPTVPENTLPKQSAFTLIKQKISCRAKPNHMQTSLHRVSEEMSRITERSNQEENSSNLKLSCASRPRLASSSKNLGKEPVEYSTSDDYFTRLQL